MFRLTFLGLSLLLCGCGSQTGGSTPGVPTGASESIVQVRDLVVDSSTMGIAIKKQADLDQYKEKFPEAVEAISSKSIAYMWGKGLREGVAPDQATVIAYETSKGDKVWAVKDNGEIHQVTAADLPKEK
ncbi:hypothetical protein VN12_11035 [Pirellula sp. SH-Sr6A]|uniref:hypothetical protein n=1 Tax=Pirellula sp. SH-Sr6A TaxID=1632865 RepID=UPI00078CD3D8|nr:hypothetical protein [Pirellula sp. SH-Sr6A]AMV32650.1 hypothetical protein VN12_11035 [Pirellula sp. SH-Sr6A]